MFITKSWARANALRLLTRAAGHRRILHCRIGQTRLLSLTKRLAKALERFRHTPQRVQVSAFFDLLCTLLFLLSKRRDEEIQCSAPEFTRTMQRLQGETSSSYF